MFRPSTSFQRTVCLCVVLSATVGSAANEEGKRNPVPNAAAQDAAMKLVGDVFKQDYAAARTDIAKIALSKKMIETARTTRDDLAARWLRMPRPA